MRYKIIGFTTSDTIRHTTSSTRYSRLLPLLLTQFPTAVGANTYDCSPIPFQQTIVSKTSRDGTIQMRFGVTANTDCDTEITVDLYDRTIDDYTLVYGNLFNFPLEEIQRIDASEGFHLSALPSQWLTPKTHGHFRFKEFDQESPSHLPLSQNILNLDETEWPNSTPQQRENAIQATLDTIHHDYPVAYVHTRDSSNWHAALRDLSASDSRYTFLFDPTPEQIPQVPTDSKTVVIQTLNESKKNTTLAQSNIPTAESPVKDYYSPDTEIGQYYNTAKCGPILEDNQTPMGYSPSAANRLNRLLARPNIQFQQTAKVLSKELHRNVRSNEIWSPLDRFKPNQDKEIIKNKVRLYKDILHHTEPSRYELFPEWFRPTIQLTDQIAKTLLSMNNFDNHEALSELCAAVIKTVLRSSSSVVVGARGMARMDTHWAAEKAMIPHYAFTAVIDSVKQTIEENFPVRVLFSSKPKNEGVLFVVNTDLYPIQWAETLGGEVGHIDSCINEHLEACQPGLPHPFLDQFWGRLSATPDTSIRHYNNRIHSRNFQGINTEFYGVDIMANTPHKQTLPDIDEPYGFLSPLSHPMANIQDEVDCLGASFRGFERSFNHAG
ncbi:hypothetical protein HOH87_07020 [bacterium]|jgi:hypothetical protein|nr:hypothetical protein [bacterium]